MRVDHLFTRHCRGVFTLALASGLAAYCVLQAQQISELQQVIALHQANAELLQSGQGPTACSYPAHPCPAQRHPGLAPANATTDLRPSPLNASTDESGALAPIDAADSLADTDTGQTNAAATTPAHEGELTPADIRELFNTVLGESVSLLYSDADLMRNGGELLEGFIANEALAVDSRLSAAYALNDLTGAPVPEHLSQALLAHATESSNEADLHETLIFIAEQRYPHTSQLAAELISSTDKNARMVGVYLLVTDQKTEHATPELLNHLNTYPDETIALLKQWARE